METRITTSGHRIGVAVIFDGDDTLWETEPLYDRARAETASMVEAAGLDPIAFDKLQRELDALNVASMGLSVERFPTSSVQALTQLADAAAMTLDDKLIADVYRASAAVFTTTAPLMPYARDLLAELSGKYRVGLLTKGDPKVQRSRIEASGLSGYFGSIDVVAEKGPEQFRRILASLNANAAGSWSIGNSVPSDVIPALKIGMEAIWIDAHVWAHERRETSLDLSDPHLHIARDLRDAPAILRSSIGSVP